MIKFYEDKFGENEEETPFRIMFKDMFTYVDHIETLTLRLDSIQKLAKDSNDKRKNVNFQTVIFLLINS